MESVNIEFIVIFGSLILVVIIVFGIIIANVINDLKDYFKYSCNLTSCVFKDLNFIKKELQNLDYDNMSSCDKIKELYMLFDKMQDDVDYIKDRIGDVYAENR